MPERLKNLIQYPARILITGNAGAGKSTLAINFILNFAKENKKCLIISYLQKELFFEGIKKMHPEIKNFLGKKVFFGHIEPRTEEEFLEDIMYSISNFSLDVLLIDPLYPDIDKGVLHDICKLLEKKNITGIFCYPKGEHLYGLVDYVINISMEREKGNIKRVLTITSRKGDVNKTFALSLENGNVLLELMP